MRIQTLQQKCPQRRQLLTELEQGLAVGFHLSRTSGHHLQIMVPGTERFLIRPEDLTVIFEQLAADKIEKSSPGVAAALDQTDIGIGEINDFRHIQVGLSALLFHRVEGKLSSARAVVELQMIPRDETVGHQAPGAEANQLA